MMFLVHFILVLTYFQVSYGQSFLCMQSFCDTWTSKNSCPTLSENCKAQNSTHNGLILPFAGPCNCCEYCVTNSNKGDKCSTGSLTGDVPSSICGDGLACKKVKKDELLCDTIETECTRKQKEYDDAREQDQLGHLQQRPNCDRNGQFESYVCIPGEICYCADEEGQRIFGEVPFMVNPDLLLKCKCSRDINKMSKYFERPLQRHEHLRCQSDGSYDPLQCIDKNCICVDVEDGKPTYGNEQGFNVTQLSNKTVPCFDNKKHTEFVYYRDCERKFFRYHSEVKKYKDDGIEVIGTVYPKCGLDGYFAKIQSTKTQKYCADIDGTILEDFVVDLKNEPLLAQNMNCNCAVARKLMKDELQRPNCQKNGNYKPMQCRRNLCRCVDINGNQIKKEIPFSDNVEIELDCKETF